MNPGDRLGRYEITALLGVGGMGEVYRALDIDLKRAVAIKVLPDEVANDHARLARFQREAEILASLNHPQIAHVHGLEKSGGRVALVMELVDGPTLAERIEDGPLAIRDALAIAKQVAVALETAHDRGVIHRDLKPANIKVRPDGQVKVLDFGLAKLVDAGETDGGGDVAASTDIMPFVTRAGVALGTPPYMAPEQVTGSGVDRRADIWAFGCLLYEMLTGHRAFEGATVSDTFAAVLGDGPDWSRLPAGVPTPVRALLRACLTRDPYQRTGQMAVARFVLDESAPVSGEVSVPVPSGGRPARLLAWTAGAALLAAGITAAVILGLVPRSPHPLVRTTVAEGTFTPSMDRTFAITPDGSQLVFVSSDATKIRVRPLDVLEPFTVLDTSAFIHCIFVSPDGHSIGYVENNYILKRIPTAGGAPAAILTTDGPARGASWGPDDSIVFATGEPSTGLQRVSARGGTPVVLTRPNREQGEADHVHPVWLPDGRGVLFTVLDRAGGLDAAKVAVYDISAGTWRAVVPGGFGGRYVAGGYLVYGAARALWAIRFDLERLQTRGSPIKVLADVAVGGLGGVAHFDVAENGTLIYPRGARDYYSRTRVPVWVDRQGRESPIGAPLDAYLHPRISPDGGRLAVVAQGDIYILNLARAQAPPARLTFEPATDWFPVWTPDGGRIVFGSWRGGGFSNLFQQDIDSATAVRLTESPEMQLPTGITQDGGTVVFHSFPKDLQALTLGPPRGVRTLAGSPMEERNGAISPDGRWLAYEAGNPARAGVLDVFVRTFPDVDGGTWQVTTDGGTFPAWSRSGRELYYLKPDGTLVAVPVEAAGQTWRAGTPAELFRGAYLQLGDGSLGRHYDVSADGRFLMLKETRDMSVLAHFVVVQNWISEIAAMVAR